MKLDGLAFPSEILTEYKLDNWEDNANYLPSKYNVADSMVTIFSLESKAEDEDQSTTIYALYIGKIDSIPYDTIIVYCHGQALHMDYYWNRAKLLANVGHKYKYGVLMMDYRGFGMSKGTSSEKGLYADVEACLNWLKSNGANPNKTIMYGFSLGTIPATDRSAYSSFKVNKLILESPLASVDNLAQESAILNISGKYISTLEFNNAEKIKDVNIPFMWMHGTIDDYLAISNGEIIYKNYKGPYSEAHRIEGANHGDVPDVWGYENYLKALDNFITR